MARIDLPHGEASERDRMWSLRPAFRDAADAFSAIIQEATMLSVRESEAARIRIARINGCEICMEARVDDAAAHGLDDAFYADAQDATRRARFSERERLAVDFAERFCAGAETFDDSFWQRLRAAFNDAEIVDLAASCAKWMGLGRINAVIGIVAACPVRIPAPSRIADAA